MLLGAIILLLGMILNRFNVSWFAVTHPDPLTYMPTFMSKVTTSRLFPRSALSIGIFSAGILAFGLAVKYLPVFEPAAGENPGHRLRKLLQLVRDPLSPESKNRSGKRGGFSSHEYNLIYAPEFFPPPPPSNHPGPPGALPLHPGCRGVGGLPVADSSGHRPAGDVLLHPHPRPGCALDPDPHLPGPLSVDWSATCITGRRNSW